MVIKRRPGRTSTLHPPASSLLEDRMGRCLLVSQSRDGGARISGDPLRLCWFRVCHCCCSHSLRPISGGGWGGVVGSEGPSPTVPLSSTHMNDARVKSEILSMFILIKSDTLHNSHKSRVSASPISSFSPTRGRVRTSFYGLNK